MKDRGAPDAGSASRAGGRTTRRQRIGLRAELLLALLPTATVLGVLALVEALARQRLLFASLASSAFLVYLDPGHAMNRTRTLALSQLGAALVGAACTAVIGPGYPAAALALGLGLVIVAMVTLDAVHPPAVATALGFGLKASDESTLALFGLAVLLTSLLIGLQRALAWLVARRDPR